MQNAVDVQCIVKYDYHSGWGFRRHKHDFYQIIYVTKGLGRIVVQDSTYELQKDMFIFIKPQEEHYLYKIQKEELKTIDIKFIVNSKKLIKSLQMIDDLNTSVDNLIKTLLEKIHVEGKQKMPLYREMANNLLEEILMTVIRTKCGDVVHEKEALLETTNLVMNLNGAAKLVGEYIEKNYSKPLTLETISNELRYSKNYICTAFKEGCRHSVLDFMNRVRIEKAKEMIKYTEYDLKQICEKVGFANIHHFSRIFKKYADITPGQFRHLEAEASCQNIFIDDRFIYQEYIDKT